MITLRLHATLSLLSEKIRKATRSFISNPTKYELGNFKFE